MNFPGDRDETLVNLDHQRSVRIRTEWSRRAGGMLNALRRAGELRAGQPTNADNASAFLSGFRISSNRRAGSFVAGEEATPEKDAEKRSHPGTFGDTKPTA